MSGSALVAGCFDGRIVMKSWATGEDEGVLEGHGNYVCGLMARGGKLWSCSGDNTINLSLKQVRHIVKMYTKPLIFYFGRDHAGRAQASTGLAGRAQV